MKRLLLLPLLSLFLSTGCDPNMDCCVKNVLTISPATLSFVGSGDSQTIDLSSSMAWMVVKPSDFPAWITVTPESGNGLATLTVTVAPNVNEYSRSYLLHFVAVNGDKAQVTVNQSGIIAVKGIELIKLPGGTFTMGSPMSEPLREDQEVEHIVTLSGFYLSKYAITNAQYCDFLNDLGVPSSGAWTLTEFGGVQTLVTTDTSYPWGVRYFGGSWQPQAGCSKHPVIEVTWYGAYAFCQWAGGRLPTEAEWEYACRAGTKTAYNTGPGLTTLQANFSGSSTTEVGIYAPNDWGFYDMHGNVREWCSDWYDAGYYAVSPSNDPQGPASGTYRVCRGGSWFTDYGVCRSAYRGFNPPWYDIFYNGFRLAVSL